MCVDEPKVNFGSLRSSLNAGHSLKFAARFHFFSPRADRTEALDLGARFGVRATWTNDPERTMVMQEA